MAFTGLGQKRLVQGLPDQSASVFSALDTLGRKVGTKIRNFLGNANSGDMTARNIIPQPNKGTLRADPASEELGISNIYNVGLPDPDFIKKNADNLIKSRVHPQYQEYLSNVPLGNTQRSQNAAGTSNPKGISITSYENAIGAGGNAEGKGGDINSVLIHEYAHQIYQKKWDEDPEFRKNFFQDWQKSKILPANVSNFAPAEAKIPISSDSRLGLIYNEIYAGLAQIVLKKGIKELPKELQKYYDWIK